MALLMEERIKSRAMPIYSLAILPSLKGVILAESDVPHAVQRASMNLKHVRGLMRGSMDFSEIEKFIAPKPIIETIKVNDVVEITSGPFIGMKGRVLEVDKAKGEVKVEITEAAYPLPVTINADYVRIVKISEETSEGSK